jgi:RimJ/RimL family protein N-acetyltransferase
LRLVVADLALLEAAIAGPEQLSEALGGLEIADGWEVFPEALPATRDALAADPQSARWGTRLFVIDGVSTLVGWGGFKGAPADGAVELGYSIAPAMRGRGFATDAVRALLEEAYSDTQVEAVLAHTLAGETASTRVLEKAGFVKVAEVEEPDDGPLWRWRHEREGG